MPADWSAISFEAIPWLIKQTSTLLDVKVT